MNDLGWDVYSFDHEDGNGQFETDFTYTDAVTMSDRLVFFRMMVGEIARKHGLFASWMPKPFADRTGSGAHYNMSLADVDGVNLFEEADDPRGCGLSTLGYQFTAGGAASRVGDLRGDRPPDRQQLQATGQAGQHVRAHVGADLRLLRRQQPDQHDAYPEVGGDGWSAGRPTAPTTRISVRL